MTNTPPVRASAFFHVQWRHQLPLRLPFRAARPLPRDRRAGRDRQGRRDHQDRRGHRGRRGRPGRGRTRPDRRALEASGHRTRRDHQERRRRRTSGYHQDRSCRQWSRRWRSRPRRSRPRRTGAGTPRGVGSRRLAGPPRSRLACSPSPGRRKSSCSQDPRASRRAGGPRVACRSRSSSRWPSHARSRRSPTPRVPGTWRRYRPRPVRYRPRPVRRRLTPGPPARQLPAHQRARNATRQSRCYSHVLAVAVSEPLCPDPGGDNVGAVRARPWLKRRSQVSPNPHVTCWRELPRLVRTYSTSSLARAAHQSQARTTWRGGSSHNFGRPRPHTPGIRRIRQPSPSIQRFS